MENPKNLKKILLIWRTQKLTFYNLTPKNQEKLRIETASVLAGDVSNFDYLREKLKSEGISFSKFANLERYKTFLTPIDPIEQRTRGCNAKDGIEIFAKR